MKKLRAGDPVIIIAGKFKGKISALKAVMNDKVLVKGINEAKRAQKGKGFVKKHLPIHISNVMYYEETKKKPSRIKIEVDKKGNKVRKLKKFDIVIK